MEYKVDVQLAVDPHTQSPVILLLDESKTKALPIFIGLLESIAVAEGLAKIKSPRPGTLDLLKHVLTLFKASVEKVVVTERRENTYYALIYAKTENGVLAIDARPSDAIGLAMRHDYPVYAAEEVFRQFGDIQPMTQASPDCLGESEAMSKEEMMKNLGNIKPKGSA